LAASGQNKSECRGAPSAGGAPGPCLATLACPPQLPGGGTLAFVDIDSMQKRSGHKKQGARFGHMKIHGKSVLVRGLNALAATISTPIAAPVIARRPT
jgi:hypothetical protein